MSRFLFVVPPLVGHTNPTIPLGRELTRRGHEVAWTGHPEVVPDLLPPGATFLPVADKVPLDVVAAMEERLLKGIGGIVGFKTLWTDFVLPIARDMVPGVHAAVDDFAPDLLVCDEHALAGAGVAEARGLPWATSATSSGDLVDPIDALLKIAAWRRDEMTAVLVAAGVDPARAAEVDPRFSPHLVLAFTGSALVGDTTTFPPHYAFVGPSFGDRPAEDDVARELAAWLDGATPGRRVLVSLGTVNWRAGDRFFGVAVEALGGMADQGLRAIVVAPPEVAPDPPANVRVLRHVPQIDLLPHLDAVVCHGGHNTVCESLAHGLPLVLAAVRDDQPIIADQVVGVGAGVRVKFTRATVPKLQEAIESVLDVPGYRDAARKVQESFAEAGGPPLAADRLEQLVAGTPPGGA